MLNGHALLENYLSYVLNNHGVAFTKFCTKQQTAQTCFSVIIYNYVSAFVYTDVNK